MNEIPRLPAIDFLALRESERYMRKFNLYAGEEVKNKKE
jgi:hypothetical protein